MCVNLGVYCTMLLQTPGTKSGAAKNIPTTTPPMNPVSIRFCRIFCMDHGLSRLLSITLNGSALTIDSIRFISICLPVSSIFVQLLICNRNRCAIHLNVIMLSRLNRNAIFTFSASRFDLPEVDAGVSSK